MRLRWTSPATTTNQSWNQNALRSDGQQGLRFLRLRGSQDSINLSGGSKIKFITQFHADKSIRPPRYRNRQLAKLMTSKVRRRVKPGSATFDSTGGSCQYRCR